jgi:outer membrane protein TolC
MLGQVNASLPIFAGFKIKNSIKAYDNMYQAETASAMQTKEEVAMMVVNYYASLYKAQKTVELLKKIKKVHNNELLISFNWRKTELFQEMIY